MKILAYVSLGRYGQKDQIRQVQKDRHGTRCQHFYGNNGVLGTSQKGCLALDGVPNVTVLTLYRAGKDQFEGVAYNSVAARPSGDPEDGVAR